MATDSVVLNPHPQVIASFSSTPGMPDSLFFGNANVTFTNLSLNAAYYVWTFGDGDSSFVSNPTHNYIDSGIFCVKLLVSDSGGCVDSVIVCDFIVSPVDTPDTVLPPVILVIPNTFSPNGDNTNDFFQIIGIENFPNNYLEIFNRWGNLIYQKSQYNNDWSGVSNITGKPLPDGAYFYIFKKGNGEADIVGDIVIFR